jgi:hypothetical protein
MMMARLITKLLLLAAVLLMPLGMSPATASAHHAAPEAMPMGHCPDQGSNQQSKRGVPACTMACAAALPAAELARSEPILIGSRPVGLRPEERLHGLHPETATPPPKHS